MNARHLSLLALAVVSLMPLSCGDDRQESATARTEVAQQRDRSEQKPVVYFGVISGYNPVVMYEAYQPIMDYLTDQTPFRFELKLGRTYDESVRFLEGGTTRLALLGPVTYLEAHARFQAVPVVRPLNATGEPLYRAAIVVLQDSELAELRDLEGRSFCFPSPHSTSGNLYGRYALEQSGVSLGDLGSFVNLKHHDQVAKAVLSGAYDAGAIRDAVAYGYQPKGLRILYLSDPIPTGPVVVRKDASPELVEAVRSALLAIDPDRPADADLLSNWNPELRFGFAEATDSDYASVRTMLNDVPGRCGQSCHPPYRF
jgi:phosphonate transport system substrate-binding protein